MLIQKEKKKDTKDDRHKEEVTYRGKEHIVEVDHGLNVMASVYRHNDGRNEKEVAQCQKQHLYQLTEV